jgi:hypothetical protein
MTETIAGRNLPHLIDLAKKRGEKTIILAARNATLIAPNGFERRILVAKVESDNPPKSDTVVPPTVALPGYGQLALPESTLDLTI